MNPKLVLIDSCIWIPFFNRPHSEIKRAVDELLDDDRAALIGPILAEILRGFRLDAHADWVASALQGVQYLELAWNDWRAAAQLGRRLAAQGHQLPLSDLALAVVALRYRCPVYTTDPHFDFITGLKRYHPR